MAELEGPRVLLRPVVAADVPQIFPWYNDPEIVAPFDRFAVDSRDGLLAAIAAAPSDPASLAPRYALVRRSDGDVVGVVGNYRAHPVLEWIDVWYVIGVRAARGAGLGSEAVGLLVDHLFRSETIERVGATCDVDNVPSVRLLERLGMRREGTLRSTLYHHGRWHDVHVYGITRPEWAARPPPARA